MFDKTECAHADCTCKVGENDEQSGIVGDDGRRFCSESCKEGEGCICPDCGCKMDTVGDGGAPTAPML